MSQMKGVHKRAVVNDLSGKKSEWECCSESVRTISDLVTESARRRLWCL